MDLPRSNVPSIPLFSLTFAYYIPALPGSKRPHKDSNSTINETLHPQSKRARLEKLEDSHTVFKCKMDSITVSCAEL